ncbi:MAG: aminoacyl-histidine dipeptidase [Thermoflexaceae bacterium]|nr:aminoacyl-histidine dipeptidase [Thermoflexaceae bacterium]
MTKILNNLEPAKVFYFFEELCAIPHGSGNTDAISEYCVEFAKQRNLKCIKDENNNVIIFKDASAGYEEHPGVIIQGHLDMVCEKTTDSSHDFTKEGLSLYVEDGFVKAKDTTLGGDDGIAVAYALAILDDDSLLHPAIEAVFTVDEEIGMLGADAMDMSPLKGKYLLNIDSEEEGVFLTSCAGGLTAGIRIPVTYEEISEDVMECEIEISGLLGGHSGTEIIRGRANAHKLLGRLLLRLNNTVRYGISELFGGTKDNAIACNVRLKAFVVKEDWNKLTEELSTYNRELLSEYRNCDDNIKITVTETGKTDGRIISAKSREFLTFILVNAPNGVMKMSSDMEGLVETSLNCGILRLEEDFIRVGFSIRSSVESAKWALYEQLEYLAEFLGCECEYSGNYPGWQYRPDSKLREIMLSVYEEQYGKKPEVTAIHAGLECGIFADRLPGIDIVSFGPDILDIHTTKERLSIESVERVWKFTVEVLKRL